MHCSALFCLAQPDLHSNLAAAWREALALRHLKAQQLETAVARWMDRTLAAAFSQWRAVAVEQQGLRRAAAFWMQGALASAFSQASWG